MTKKLFEILRERKIKICAAESITGGKFSSEIVKYEGASKILDFSIISYSTQSKKVFFLKKPIIDKFGVVSKEVAIKMSTEIIKYSKFTNIIGISCTGLASRNLEYSNKDQGIVYIATTYKSKTNVVEKNFKMNDRSKIIDLSVKEMFNQIKLII